MTKSKRLVGDNNGRPAIEATYHGTIAQQEAFKNEHSSFWANFCVLTVVHCSDGDYAADGLDHW